MHLTPCLWWECLLKCCKCCGLVAYVNAMIVWQCRLIYSRTTWGVLEPHWWRSVWRMPMRNTSMASLHTYTHGAYTSTLSRCVSWHHYSLHCTCLHTQGTHLYPYQVCIMTSLSGVYHDIITLTHIGHKHHPTPGVLKCLYLRVSRCKSKNIVQQMILTYTSYTWSMQYI